MSKKRYNCDDMETRFEAAIDGELNPEENRVYEYHLNECAPCRAEHEKAQRIARELPVILIDNEEVEARALKAARGAINQIGTDRKHNAAFETKLRKKRTLFLGAAWFLSAVILWRAVSLVGSEARLALESVTTSDLLTKTAAALSMTPSYFVFFLFGMAALTGGAVFALSLVWSRD